jgi:carbonic anhydrase/acetyltransferase-like protein (isoleucine patch superfamily)
MTLLPYQGVWPTIADDAFIAPGAMLIGDVRVGAGASVWYNAVLRADTEPITIGARSNVQDNAVIHVDPGLPCVIGEDCTIGHGAIVHAAHVGNRVLISMHATILSGATIADDVIIGAGAVVSEGRAIAGGMLVLGVPGKVIRPLQEDEQERIVRNGQAYLALATEHRASLQTANIKLDRPRHPKRTM